MDSRPFWEWVNERHAIYIRKELRAGADPADLWVPQDCDLEECDPEHFAVRPDGPLTDDPVLQQYRFCNVFRELDRVTQWIGRNIQEPFADHPDLWMMLAIARYINWPPTLQWLMNRGETACPFSAWPDRTGDNWPQHLKFTPEDLGNALDAYSATGAKVYTGAYMIRAESNTKAEWYSWTKQQYIARIVLGRLWEDRDLLSRAFSVPGQTLENAWGFFQASRYIGWGPFMAYQVVVDMRHSRYLRHAPDINTWAALGPGSRRGLNRLSGRPVDYPLKQAQGLEEMLTLWGEQDRWRAPWVPRIELSDIQNALCETDKIMRVRNGEGRPRSMYVPGRGS